MDGACGTVTGCCLGCGCGCCLGCGCGCCLGCGGCCCGASYGSVVGVGGVQAICNCGPSVPSGFPFCAAATLSSASSVPSFSLSCFALAIMSAYSFSRTDQVAPS